MAMSFIVAVETDNPAEILNLAARRSVLQDNINFAFFSLGGAVPLE
jgi:hypothetical protein